MQGVCVRKFELSKVYDDLEAVFYDAAPWYPYDRNRTPPLHAGRAGGGGMSDIAEIAICVYLIMVLAARMGRDA